MKHGKYIALVAVALLAASCAGSGAEAEAGVQTEATTPAETPLELAAAACDIADSALGDAGTTLTLDGGGKDDRQLGDGGFGYSAGKLEIEDITCALDELGTSDAIWSRMKQTRAMDGMQEQSGGGYTYVWSYHPDNGLDIIITEAADA